LGATLDLTAGVGGGEVAAYAQEVMPPSSPDAAKLRIRGQWPSPDAYWVGLVGSRRPTPYGEAVAERLGSDLASAGVVVVSGLALGVDAAAHEGALGACGSTVAVLGTGLDVIYPAANAHLARRILDEGGALVSQFRDGTPPRRGNFPQRNWTLASLCHLVVIVEAGEGSGALITAEAALAQGRQVMAVPGSVFSPVSVGCHQLLRDGAGLVQNARDVMAELRGPGEVLDDPLQPPARLGVEPAHSLLGLLRHLPDGEPREPEQLASRLSLELPDVISRLSKLEMEGRVRRQGAGYVKVHGRETMQGKEE
jgi:DNA processing protein